MNVILLCSFLSIKLTVGICAFNEASNIGNLLNNILEEQALAPESEVLVVCSGCTDATVSIVQSYSVKDNRIKLFVEAKRQGKASAINYILSHANYDPILFVSADTFPTKGSFQSLAQRLQAQNVGIVCGNPVPVNQSNSRIGRLVQLLWSFHGHVFEELNRDGLARHASEIFCMRKGILDHIPSETVNDDAYIAVTTKERGWLVEFDAQAKVLIRGPMTFQEYFRQRRRILFGHYQIRKLTGKSPQYLVHLLPQHPLKTLKMSLWLFKNNTPIDTAIFLFTEFWVNLFSIADFIAGKTHTQWSTLTSTKAIVTQLAQKKAPFEA
jgi:cellulose synthase/poly-beta-1,6-N-acetylglucosamine synthase-like glycosyltransferase